MENPTLNWVIDILKTNNYLIQNTAPEIIQNTPWSEVYRFTTDRGFVYLKTTPPAIALEAKIIRLLQNKFDAHVPEVIAFNSELNCFLMKDAGKTLRENLKKSFDINLLCKAVEQFTSLQITVAEDVNVFIELGVPDWRLNKLPMLYSELLMQKELLYQDGLSKSELYELENLIPKISQLCDKLSRYNIKESIVQPDFNDNNTLITNDLKKITIIDLGEIVISHPFFSLLNFLEQIKKHHGITETDQAYCIVLETCFKNYLFFESKQNITEAFALAKILSIIYGSLAIYRLILAVGHIYQPGRLSSNLREFIKLVYKDGI